MAGNAAMVRGATMQYQPRQADAGSIALTKALEILLLKAKNAEMRGSREEAAQIYRHILAQIPNHARARKALAQLGNGADGHTTSPASATAVGPAADATALRAEVDQLNALARGNDMAAVAARAETLIARYPDVAALHNLLGSAYLQLGRIEAGAQALSRVVQLTPDHGEAHFQLGLAQLELRQADQAVASLSQAARLLPDNPRVFLNLASALKQQDKPQETIAVLRHALALQPDFPEALFNLGNTLKAMRNFDEAIANYHAAIALRPDFVMAINNMANALRESRRTDEAIAAYRKVLAIKPDFVEVSYNLGNALLDAGNIEDAIAEFRKVVAQRPEDARALNSLGSALGQDNCAGEAVEAFQRAIAVAPDYAEAHNNLATSLLDLGRIDEAAAAYDRALAINPDYADAHFNKGLIHLTRGDFATGLPLYEWRKRKSHPVANRTVPAPLWLGEQALDGRTILVHHEQGLGDTIQFIRYAPLLRARGARVIVSVQDALVPLLAGIYPDVELVGDSFGGAVDYQVPLLSLPLALGTRLETIPAAVPYLAAKPVRIARWRERLGDHGFKIGICWHGHASPLNPGRAFPLDMFRGIAALPGVRLISLHKGQGEAQLERQGNGLRVETLGSDFDGAGAFMDTAAVMTLCDLVITLDTSVAHVAGALGVPVWVALKHMADWRWLLHREDTPWYPTMRLFRQDTPNDWNSVFGRIEAALAPLVAERQDA